MKMKTMFPPYTHTPLAVLSHPSPTPSAFAEHMLSRSGQFYIQESLMFSL